MRDLESLSREELIGVVLDQHRLIERLRTDMEQLEKRASAAPFSEGKGKSNPRLRVGDPARGISGSEKRRSRQRRRKR